MLHFTLGLVFQLPKWPLNLTFSTFIATPPPKLDHPPKYDTDVYEESGKAMAIAILDLTESNPWTRLTCSAHKNLRGVRDWLKKYIKAKAEEEQEKANKSTPTKIQNGSLTNR